MNQGFMQDGAPNRAGILEMAKRSQFRNGNGYLLVSPPPWISGISDLREISIRPADVPAPVSRLPPLLNGARWKGASGRTIRPTWMECVRRDSARQACSSKTQTG